MTRRIAWRSSMGKYVRSGQVNDGSTAGRASRWILPLGPAVGKFAAASCAIAHAAHGAWHRNPENSHRRHPLVPPPCSTRRALMVRSAFCCKRAHSWRSGTLKPLRARCGSAPYGTHGWLACGPPLGFLCQFGGRLNTLCVPRRAAVRQPCSAPHPPEPAPLHEVPIGHWFSSVPRLARHPLSRCA